MYILTVDLQVGSMCKGLGITDLTLVQSRVIHCH